MLNGLTTSEARRRLTQYGPNELVAAEKRSVFARFFLRFKNPLVLILIIAAVISGFTGDLVSATIILAIVALSALLDFINTYKAEKASDALKKRVAIVADVLRDGIVTEIPVTEIVPGDVVMLKPGDVVPADGTVLRSNDFFVNESALTGESFPVEKTPNAPLYMGSSAVSGEATVVITVTGKHTKFSAIAEALVRREEPTEFDRNIRQFSSLVIRAMLVLVVAVFFVNALFKRDPVASLLFAVALAVGLTPELLPMIIALNLSKGAIRLASQGVIVKQLSSIQNFGNMDVFCCDKTGTLTEGKIALFKHVDGTGAPSEAVLLYAYLGSLYHTGFVNPFDTAVREYRKVNVKAYQKIDEVPFDYERRRSSMVVEHAGKRLLICKGAPEDVFAVSGDVKKQAAEEYRRLSADGYRVLGIAVREVDADKDVYAKHDERDLTFIGFAAFLDPPKKSVVETLRLMKTHGVEVKIITGDNELVTQKIAADIKLNVKGVLIGKELDRLDEDALRTVVERTTIFARVNPSQKERIIHALQENKHVVGFLGDGINDAPSLKDADVGVSVNNAVDVAKDAADLILVKKSLHDLILGVIEGRKIFANTQKYLMMTLSSNFGNMFSMAGASLLLPFLPMLPTQILFNNFLYDASQFAIPLDRVDPDDLKTPKRLHMASLRRYMIVFGLVSSAFDFLTFGLLYFAFRLPEHAFQTGWFLESLTTQTLVIYIIRTKRLPFFKSRPSPYLVWSTAVALVVGWVVANEVGGQFFHFVPLPRPVLLSIACVVAAYLLSVELAKRWFYAQEQKTPRLSQ